MIEPLPHGAADALCRRSFYPFLQRSFHTVDPGKTLGRADYLEAMACKLEEVAYGDCRRLMITIPPRHLKSVTASVAFPAWLLGRDPRLRLLCASYGKELSRAHGHKVLATRWYGNVFPETQSSISKNTDHEVHTRQGGFRLALSVDGTFTGLGGDIVIVDDLMKAIDAESQAKRQRVQRFYDETLVSRLNDKMTGRIIVIQQRLHEDDLVGHLIDKGGFDHLNLTAIAEKDEEHRLYYGGVFRRKNGDVLSPDREPMEALEVIRRDMGDRAFQAQYQQNPIPLDSTFVRWHRIRTYDAAPDREQLQYVVQSWDTALQDGPKSDFSVCTTWGYHDRSWLLLDVLRLRLEYPDLLARIRMERKRWRPDEILVEAACTGISVLSDLRRDFRCLGDPDHHAPNCLVKGPVPTNSKEERLASQVDRLYSGHAKLPKEAPWLATLKSELVGFPGTTHDDQVDSVSQFLKWSVERGGRSALQRDSDRPRR